MVCWLRAAQTGAAVVPRTNSAPARMAGFVRADSGDYCHPDLCYRDKLSHCRRLDAFGPGATSVYLVDGRIAQARSRYSVAGFPVAAAAIA